MGPAIEALETRIRRLTADVPFAVHWQVSPLAGPASETASEAAPTGHGAEAQLPSFSTRKVSLLLACLAGVRRGELDLAQRLSITEPLRGGVQAGIMRNLAAGVELSLEDHLRQMMITSDNICTQLVFDALARAAAARGDAADPLQAVNDYCAGVGLHATVHREIFPRSGELTWHHGIEQVTVTSAADQARLLVRLGRGTHDAAVAAALQLSPELCRLAVEMMHQLHTPLLGANTGRLRFAEKNGRGLRSLSQIGLACTPEGEPVAAVAVFAEHIPTRLPDGVPGRLLAYELFRAVGCAVEDWHAGTFDAGTLDADEQQTEAQPAGAAAFPQGVTALRPREITAQHPELAWQLSTGDGARSSGHGADQRHSLAGVGALFAAVALAERGVGEDGVSERGAGEDGAHEDGLLQLPVTITAAHRRQAGLGPLRPLTGDLTLSLADALGLVLATADAAAALAILEALPRADVDLLAAAGNLLPRLGLGSTRLTGLEQERPATGELLLGETTPADLVRLLQILAVDGGLVEGGLLAGRLVDNTMAEATGRLSQAAATQVLGWMARTVEPAGLAYGLPGYGPHTVPQWSLAGSGTRRSSSAPGWTSVLIIRRDHAGPAPEILCVAAHLPGAGEGEPRTGLDATRVLGTLGLAAWQHGVGD